MSTISIQHITPEQKKKRIIIQNNFYNLMDKLDGLTDAEIKSGKKSYNRIQWEKRFAAMSDIDFHEFMKRMKHERDFNISYEAESFTTKNKMNVARIKKIAKDLKIKLMEYVIFPHKNRENLDHPVVSKTPLMIIVISVKRLQQMLAKKNKVSSETNIRNELTNTVTGDDKGGRMSNVQTLSLITTNQYAAVKEFLSIRSDNANAKREMLKEIEATGKVHLSNYNLQTSDMQSVQAMEVFLKGAGLRSNILIQNSKTTQELNKRKDEVRSLEDLTNLDDFNNEAYKNYQVLIFGEIHHDEDSINKIEKIITKFKPEYLLHEQGIIDEVIDRTRAREVIKENNGKVINHQFCDITYLLNKISNLDSKLVGIDISPDDLKSVRKYQDRFTLREANMLQRIQQFKNLENKPKIVVVLGDTHLRFFPTQLLGNTSPITNEFKSDSSVLIVRASQDNREINIPKEYSINFDKLILDNTFKSIQSKIFRSDIYMKYKPDGQEKEYHIGYLLLEKEIKTLDKQTNTLEPLIFDNQRSQPTFVYINIFKDFEDYELEKPIIDRLKSINNKEIENSFLITKKDSKFYSGEKEFTEIWSYIDKKDKDQICIKLN